MKWIRQVAPFFGQVFAEWNHHRVPALAASLAYYTLFSMVPLLVISIAIVGTILGQDSARTQIFSQVQELVGEDGARFIDSLITGTRSPQGDVVATVVSLVSLIFGAAGVFNQMKVTLRVIWNIPQERPPSGWWAILNALREQLISVAMVISISFLILVTLVLNAVLAGLVGFASEYLAFVASWSQVLTFALTFVLTILLIAAIFKFVPGIWIAWGDVLLGASITALLFTLGRFAVGFYLGQSAVVSTYGAAGSLVVVLIWVYYSAQILFLGAEFTQVFARMYGSRRALLEAVSAEIPQEANAI